MTSLGGSRRPRSGLFGAGLGKDSLYTSLRPLLHPPASLVCRALRRLQRVVVPTEGTAVAPTRLALTLLRLRAMAMPLAIMVLDLTLRMAAAGLQGPGLAACSMPPVLGPAAAACAGAANGAPMA